MQLDQHSIVIVMMVVFSSTLLISAGLMVALMQSVAGRLWAFGHLLLSAGGLLLAINAITVVRVELAACAGIAFIVGKMLIYCGVRAHQGMGVITRSQLLATFVAVAAMPLALASHDPMTRLHEVGYASVAVITAATMMLLMRARVRYSEIGLPLVLVACAVQFAAQLYGLGMVLGARESVMPFYGGSANAVLVLAPLVATLLGLFGYTVMALERVIANKERGARIDGLTGLLNRTALDAAATSMIGTALRYRQALSCLVIDVDYFKQVNDLSGHRAGDAVLQAIAGALDNSRRASDVAGRYGGEEFCVLCPHTDELQATALARRILRKVRAIPLPGPAGAFASVSIGIAQLRDDNRAHTEDLWQQLFSAADRALYVAKRRGRDRYVVASALAAESRQDELPLDDIPQQANITP